MSELLARSGAVRSRALSPYALCFPTHCIFLRTVNLCPTHYLPTPFISYPLSPCARSCYALSLYLPTLYPLCAISLPTCYAMPGTDNEDVGTRALIEAVEGVGRGEADKSARYSPLCSYAMFTPDIAWC